jgi:acyl dehydratase
MEPKDNTIDTIAVGDIATVEKSITEDYVKGFAELSGDYNPLHMDQEFVSKTPFGERVAHGFSLAILVSQLVGMFLPGRRCLLLEESMTFRKPVFIGDTVSVIGKVIQCSMSTRIVKIEIEVHARSSLVAQGVVITQVLQI